LGEEPEVKGLVEGMEVTVDFIPGRKMGEGLVEEGTVFGRGEGFDVDEGLEERSAKAAGRTEQGGQTGTEVFVGKIGAQEGQGFRWKILFHVLQKADQDMALNAGDEAKVGEELQMIHG
jgi:hypothetical protein